MTPSAISTERNAGARPVILNAQMQAYWIKHSTIMDLVNV